jgi:hypothetical protein
VDKEAGGRRTIQQVRQVIKKLYVNIPLLDAMQVPMYAKYIKYMLGNKRALLTTEVMQLTE